MPTITVKLDKKRAARPMFFLILSTALLLMTARWKRFAEYFPPFAILFAAFTLQPWITGARSPFSQLPADVLDELAKRGAGFRSLKDAWADTTTPHGKLMLTILGGLAEFERELIRSRTGEGRKRAMARGVRFGRPPKLTPHQRQEALARLDAGETQTDIARSYNVDATTIGRLLS